MPDLIILMLHKYKIMLQLYILKNKMDMDWMDVYEQNICIPIHIVFQIRMHIIVHTTPTAKGDFQIICVLSNEQNQAANFNTLEMQSIYIVYVHACPQHVNTHSNTHVCIIIPTHIFMSVHYEYVLSVMTGKSF